MKAVFVLTILAAASSAFAASIKVDVNIMPRVVFTGDSQTCGRVGAWDYPQMLSWEMPIRVFNTGVGGTNTRQLLSETTGGTAEVRKGEKEIRGTGVGWHAGPYPGQKISLGARDYTIDRIVTTSYKDRLASIWITEPAQEDFSGGDYNIEPGWRVRMAEREPDYVCLMYSVNDTGWKSEQFLAQLEDILARTRELGAQPIFLSGVPLMEAAKGGSHPGSNDRVETRANDLAAFCRERDIPYGDVFRALMALDQQATSVWADTVHPTTDGSTAILNALRSIFRDLGVTDNPYYVRGYRTTGGLVEPDDTAALIPFTTSQPDYSAANVQNENLFDLAAIEARDEYGAIAAEDEQCVASDVPVLLEFGIGDAPGTTVTSLQVTGAGGLGVSVFDWRTRRWASLEPPLPAGTGGLSEVMSNGRRDGAVWVALEAPDKVILDYAAITLEGDVAPWRATPANLPIAWPPPGYLTWDDSPENLISNGNLADADGEGPRSWYKHGEHASYIQHGLVAEGTGGFVQEKRIDLFKAEGQRFSESVRPLDMLEIAEGPEHASGRFLISQVLDDQTLRVRRPADEEIGGLAFEIVRSSGCPAVPGGCAVQCRSDSHWETTVSGLTAGAYQLGFFYRAYDPANMKAKSRPARVANVQVRLAPCGQTPSSAPLATAEDMQASYQWQRAGLGLTLADASDLHLRLAAQTDTAVEYTGLTLHRR